MPQESLLVTLLVSFLPILLILFLLFFFLNQMQGGGGRLMSFSKSKARSSTRTCRRRPFADVAGADEAVEELEEIKEFLQDPAKFTAVGAKIPKGVLLYGPPGTGKTSWPVPSPEAEVPFFSISGPTSSRCSWAWARLAFVICSNRPEQRPAIIFVDEIDAVGRHRGAGWAAVTTNANRRSTKCSSDGRLRRHRRGHPHRCDQPARHPRPGAAAPGRFDRQIAVESPDLSGREAILKVHATGKPLAPDVDLLSIAKRSPGFTGADLANVLNEAALLTARNGDKLITNQALDGRSTASSPDRRNARG